MDKYFFKALGLILLWACITVLCIAAYILALYNFGVVTFTVLALAIVAIKLTNDIAKDYREKYRRSNPNDR